MEPAVPKSRPTLRVLLVEDSEFDARVVASLLRAGGYDVASRRVDTAAAMREALARERWDLVVADHQMPEFDAAQALRIVQESGLDLPFIIVSGGIGEETAVALMKAGAHDFLIKGQLGRLLPAVERELREARNRAERRASELRLRRLWETSPDAILVMDEQGRVAFVNPAAQVVFGRSEAELVGRSFESLASPGENLTGLTLLSSENLPGTTTRLMEMVGRHAAGREVIMEVAFSDMEMQGRRYHIAFVRDITARRAAERALRAAEQEFNLARDIQQRLFPRHAPQVPGFDLAGTTHPAVQTGGDYYDFLTMPEGDVGLVVSDVSGHGMGPALITAETRAYLRIAAFNRRDAGMVLSRANMVLAEDLEDGTRFVTSLLVRLNPRERSLAYANAGHTAGYVLASSGEVRQQLSRGGPPLGVQPESVYHESPPLALASGDILLLLTDGIEEAESPAGEVFGARRVLEVVRAHRHQAAAEILNAVWRAVQTFSAGQPQKDDVTLIVAKVN
jgi:PAS domain S-box-containing protein